jgi:type I restriction enzyme M protein
MTTTNSRTAGRPLGFEATLWAAAHKLRGHMDADEYKHVVLGRTDLHPTGTATE